MADLTGMMQAVAGATPAGNPNAWDISKAYYDVGADAWDISKAVYASRSFSVASQDTTPLGIFFKPDGTKMYMSGSLNDSVYEYTLSIPWLVSSASYVQSFSVSAQVSSPAGLFFKSDGTKMYVLDFGGDDVNEYDLSSAWDISTASYSQNFSVATEDTSPYGIFFKPDGTKMYVVGDNGNDINEYSLSSAWDVSSASYVQNFSVASQDTNPQGIFFKSDGTKMYVNGSGEDYIYEYSLSSAWDISTASYVQNFSLGTQDTNPNSVFFRPDGSGFYFVGGANDTIYQYVIGGFDVSTEETAPQGLFFKPDGTKMYVIGSDGDDVNEYSLSSAWDILSASYSQNFSVATEDTTPLGVFFKPDGTKMYVAGNTGDDVNEYDLSSAWDISTASYVQNKSVSAQDTAPSGIFFKPDGTKMYIVGGTNDSVYEYNLSSAWNISTASYLQTFSISAQEATPQDVFFKPDGTKMYITGTTGDDINEYSLSSAWDISSASYVQNFSVGPQDNAPRGLFWKDDGTQFWIVGDKYRVFPYLISPT